MIKKINNNKNANSLSSLIYKNQLLFIKLLIIIMGCLQSFILGGILL